MLLLSKVWPHFLIRIGSVIICFVIGSTVNTSEFVTDTSSSSSLTPASAVKWKEEVQPLK
jgi:hypothetical protein